MKLVFKVEEVAAALGKSTVEFNVIRPNLEARGFPKPIPGLDESWGIMAIVNWVNKSQEDEGQEMA